MSYTVQINYGTGWINLTDYFGRTILHKDGFKITPRLHKDFHSVINIGSFTIDLDSTLASALIQLPLTQKIQIDVDRDGVDYFTGFARPVTDFPLEIREGYVDSKIKFTIVDRLWLLSGKPTEDLDFTGYKVCDPADENNSAVHEILYHAGIDPAWLNITATIDSVLPGFKLEKGDKTYFEAVDELLYDYAHVIDCAPDGTIYLYNWAPETLPDPGTITEYAGPNVQKFRTRRLDKEVNKTVVEYYTTYSSPNETLFSRTANYQLGDGGLGYQYPPDNPNVTGEESHKWHFKQEDDDPIGVSNLSYSVYFDQFYYDLGYQIAIKRRYVTFEGLTGEGTFYHISGGTETTHAFATSEVSHSLADQSSSIKIEPTNTWGGEPVYRVDLRSYKVKGDVLYRKLQRTAETEGEGIEVHTSEHIYNHDDADALAQALQNNLEYSSRIFEFRSNQLSQIGDYVRIVNVRHNIDTTARIVERKDSTANYGDGEFRVYDYVAEQVTELNVVYTSVIGGQFQIVASPASVADATDAASEGLWPDGHIVKAIEGYKLSEGFNPQVPGLFFSGDFLGYWDDEWTVYIKDDGTFLFKGDEGNYLSWDGSRLHVEGDLFASGDSVLAGKVVTGSGIQSDNYEAGISGWAIDGDGYGEFQDVIIRNNSTDGLWRMRFDGTTVVVEKNNSGVWEVVTRIGGDNYEASLFVTKGILHPNRNAEGLDIGLRAPDGSFVYDMEDDYQDKSGDDLWDTKTNLTFTSESKLGTYALTHNGLDGELIRSAYTDMAWSSDLGIAFWFYRGAYGGSTTVQEEITEIQCIADPGHDSSFTLARLDSDLVESSIAVRLKYLFAVDFSTSTDFGSSAYDNAKGLATDGNGVWIVTGILDGKVLRSTDNGGSWSPVTFSSVNGMECIATDGNGTWIVGGYNGHTGRSTDNGASWSALANPLGATIYEVATDGNGTWGLVGSDGDIAMSTDDGDTWTTYSIGGGVKYSIAYSNGTWIVVGATGYIGRSTDGVNWTSQTYPNTYSILSVDSDGAGTWRAAEYIGTHLAISTDDGLTWSIDPDNPTDTPFTTGRRRRILYDGLGCWFVVGEDGITYRKVLDGSWENLASSSDDHYDIGTDSNGVYIVVGTDGGTDAVKIRSEASVTSGSEDVEYVIALSAEQANDEESIATAVAAAIDDSADWTITTPSVDTVRITQVNEGNVTDAADVDTGFTITTTQQGSHPNDDPPLLLSLASTLPLETAEVYHWYPSSLKLRINGDWKDTVAIDDDAWNMLWLYHSADAGVNLWANNTVITDGTALTGTNDIELKLTLDSDLYDVSIDEVIVNPTNTLNADLISDYYTGALPWSEGIDYSKDLAFAAAPDGGRAVFKSPIYDVNGNLVSGGGAETIGDDAWHEVGTIDEPAFENGWTNYGGNYATVGFMRDSNGIVHLKGLAKSGSTGSMFTLPEGYRPTEDRLFNIIRANNAIGRVNIRTTGVVDANLISSGWTSIEGISFVTDPAIAAQAIKGPQGEAGPAGPAEFEWDVEQIYNTDQLVGYEGDLYRSIQDSNLGNIPGNNGTWWSQITGDLIGVMHMQHRIPNTQDSGTVTGGQWNIGPLTSVEYNNITGASLDTNTYEFTLPPGKYYIYATRDVFYVNGYATRIYDVTNAQTAIIGEKGYADQGDGYNSEHIPITGILEPSIATTYRVELYAQTTRSTTGWGYTTNSYGGEDAVWGNVTIQDLNSLVGPKGDQGDQGIEGPAGIQGPQGDELVIDAVGLDADKTTYDSESKGFIYYASDTELLYQKLSATSGDWTPGITYGIPNSIAQENVFSNEQIMSASPNFQSGRNYMTVGPIEIADGVTIDIPDGVTWVVI